MLRAQTWITKKPGKKADELGAKKVKDRVASICSPHWLSHPTGRPSDLGGGKGVIRFDPDVLGWPAGHKMQTVSVVFSTLHC